MLWAAECKASPVVHVPGVARYFFSKSLRLERVFAIPAPAWFEVMGPPPTLTRVVRGKYAGGRGKFYGDLTWLDLLRFLHKWEVNFAVGSFVI